MMHLQHAVVDVQGDNPYPDTEPKSGLPLDFPLDKCLVVINGRDAVVSIPLRDDGGHVQKMVRMDRLVGVSVQEGPKGGKPLTLTGTSTHLSMHGNLKGDDAIVTLTVKDWAVCDTC